MSRSYPSAFALALAGCVGAMSPSHADVPANGVQIGAALPAGFEASGVAWHRARWQYLVVSDDGRLVALSPSGALQGSWTTSGDLEGIAIADPNTSLVYLANEDPPAIVEFDLSASAVRRVFDLSPWIAVPNGRGLEALAFAQDPADAEGGTFLCGSTGDGRVHRFRLPIASSTSVTSVAALGSFDPSAASDEVRGLCVDAVAGVVYALTSDPDRIEVLSLAGAPLASHALPAQVADQPEGLALFGCELVVCVDAAPSRVVRFAAFDDHSACDTLAPNGLAVSATFGGTQLLALDLGPASAGHAFVVFGSRRLGRPGLVGGAGLVLPLELDDYFFFTLAGGGANVLTNFVGVLDANGRATAAIVVPPGSPVAASLVGTRLFHAAAVVDPNLGAFVHASNAAPLLFGF
jgi:hypothetical protein